MKHQRQGKCKYNITNYSVQFTTLQSIIIFKIIRMRLLDYRIFVDVYDNHSIFRSEAQRSVSRHSVKRVGSEYFDTF